jgi:ABC-type transporter Mla subunit MlaD
MSHVGCRLMVASSANTSRPFAPGAWGDIARALATKAAMSSDADGFVSGNDPFLPDAGETSLPDFGLVGSRDMQARKWLQAYVALASDRVNAPNPIRE